MTDHLEVVGTGTDRDTALADADRQAAVYFGGNPRTRHIGRAHCCEVVRAITGETLAHRFEVEVVYITEAR